MSAAQWKLLEGACTNLKHIKETVKALEGEKEPTINKVLERLYVNHQILDDFITDSRNVRCKYEITFARKLKQLLEERFPNKGLTVNLGDQQTIWTLNIRVCIYWRVDFWRKH